MASTKGLSRRYSYSGSGSQSSEQTRRSSKVVQLRQSASVEQNGQASVGLNSATPFSSAADLLSGLERKGSTTSNMSRHGGSRRSARNAEEPFTCSQQSILSAMDRFVKSVNNMDATVLVPSKLRDMEIRGTKSYRRPSLVTPSTDMYSYFSMLHDVKNELLWGPAKDTLPPTSSRDDVSSISSGRSTPRDLKHNRQVSEDSLGSAGSSSDQDTDSEFESVTTDRDTFDEQTAHIATSFRHHLQSLQAVLHQLADSADFLATRYQEDVDCL